MEGAIQSPRQRRASTRGSHDESSLFSSEPIVNLQKLIFSGSPLSEVLANIAEAVEAQAKGMSCTIWLPDQDGKELYCAAAPSLPGFSSQVGTMVVGPKGGSCGTAVYRKESVYVTDILTDPIWENYSQPHVAFWNSFRLVDRKSVV